MRTVNLKQIIAIIAFLALAGFSCFWTAESLFIWQPSITLVGAWLIAIVFYIVASICFSLFLKSFDRNSWFQPDLFSSRAGHLVWGFLGILLFWIMVSLPTNTHTLLYRASIKNVVTSDLNRTLGYLQELKDNNVEINIDNAKGISFHIVILYDAIIGQNIKNNINICLIKTGTFFFSK